MTIVIIFVIIIISIKKKYQALSIKPFPEPTPSSPLPPVPSPVPARPLPTSPLPSTPGPPQPAQPRRRRPSGSFERRRAGAPSPPAHYKRYFYGALSRWYLHCGAAEAADPIPHARPHEGGELEEGVYRSLSEGERRAVK